MYPTSCPHGRSVIYNSQIHHSHPHLRHSRKNGNQQPPRHSRAGGNQLAAGRRILRRQSRRELDGDFISPSFPRRRESNRAFGAVIIAQAIIAAFLLFARSANRIA